MDPPAQGDGLKLTQGETRKLEDRLLEKLQAADDES
jgi:hypothetical protein